MQGFCDSCEESVDHLFDLTRLPEFREVVRRQNYRKVCQLCYDDLYDDIKQQQENQDRRAEVRHSLKLKINVSGVDREGQKFSEQTFTHDVSLSGAKISISHHIEKGSVLTLSVPDTKFEAAVIIELVWQDGKSKSAGLRIVEASDAWVKMINQAIETTKAIKS
jgi:hypothetical protein